MPPRISGDQRTAIAEDIRNGVPRNQVALKHDVSAGTVTNIAREFNLTFDRSATKRATEARQADNASVRAELTGLLYLRAREALQQMVQPHLVFAFGGKENSYNQHKLDRPPTGDLRNLMTVAGIAVQRAAELDRFDADARDKPAVDAWLETMLGGASSTPAL